MAGVSLHTDRGFDFAVALADTIYYANALNKDFPLRLLKITPPQSLLGQELIVEVQFASLAEQIAEPWVRKANFSNVSHLEFTDVDVHWHAGKLLNVQVNVPADVTIRVLDDNQEELAKTVLPLELASPDAWRSNSVDSFRILAAHVRPNDPKLRPILDDAVNRLKKLDNNPSLSGYQEKGHPPFMVQAIYEAMLAMKITYSNPPASWDVPGQRIRSTAVISDERVATCLDSAVLFAALLENVGLAPVVALIPGHAFVGYWSNEQLMFSEEHEFAIRDAVNAVDKGDLVLFETTTVTKGHSFQQALQEARARLSVVGAMSQESGYDSFAVNIAFTRLPLDNKRVLPMPVRSVQADGSVEVIEYTPEDLSINKLIDQLTEEISQKQIASPQTVQQVPPRVKTWLDSLLDLSLRNPLINFRPGRQSLPIFSAPNFLGPLEDFLATEQSLEIGAVFELKPNVNQNTIIGDERGEFAMDPEFETNLVQLLKMKKLASRLGSEATVRTLRSMASQAKLIQEETGSNGLFLSLGSLVWVPEGKQEVRSPLLLLPVNIVSKNRARQFTISLDTSSAITPNYSLVEKLRSEKAELKLDALVNLEADNAGIDVPKLISSVRQEIAMAGVKGYRVDEDIALGFFNFSSYRLWRDLLDNWSTFERNPLVKHLIHTPNQPFEDPVQLDSEPDLDAMLAELPIPADSSQAVAVSHALAGQTFVLQGPPGTGKSQTITNMLARALHDGKRILFVAEKKDALDVVKERIDGIGLGAFTLDLHDKGMSLKSVKQQLRAVLDISVQTDQVGFEVALAEYKDAVGPLQSYRERLHDVGKFGESISSVIDKYLSVNTATELEVPGSFVANGSPADKDALHAATKSLATIGEVSGDASTNPWSLSGLTDQPSVEVLQQLRQVVSDLQARIAEISASPVAREFFEHIESFEEITSLGALEHVYLSEGAVLVASTPHATEAREYAIESLRSFKDALAAAGVNLSQLPSIDMNGFAAELLAVTTSGGLFKGRKLNALVKRLNLTLQQEVVSSKEQLPATVEQLKQVQTLGNHARDLLVRVEGISTSPDVNVFAPEVASDYIRQLEVLSEVVNLNKVAHSGGPSISELSNTVRANPHLASIISGFSQSMVRLMVLLQATVKTTDLWRGQRVLGSAIVANINKWHEDATSHNFIQLSRWVDMVAVAEQFDRLGAPGALQPVLTGDIRFADAPSAFLKGFYNALLLNMLVERGFNTFNGVSNTDYIRKLSDAHARLRELIPGVYGGDLLTRRGFDSSAKTGAVGDLILTINQQRTPRNASVRSLLRKHWNTITKITPCVLASPDSAVRFIDAELEPFDVVIFDEASQIRVANSIGAMGRAKASVVVGDKNQMPPTAVAQTKLVDDADDADEDDFAAGYVESILSMCEIARVPDIMLNWHYRSEDETLICFSNAKYYFGRLNSFPAPVDTKQQQSLTFEFVEGGQFLRPGMSSSLGKKGTNPAEVRAIVNEIGEHLRDPARADLSLGVVTFNVEQRKAIQDALVNSDDELIQQALANGVGDEEIFVKNLETVQGSERDVILFSVAFSKNENGVLPLNFGPLNNQGGERRLNVAVTRSRVGMKIFCSFMPHELVSRNPSEGGLADLGMFLSIAKEGPKEFPGLFADTQVESDRHRKLVAEALRNEGLVVEEDFGLSGFKVDLAIMQREDPSKAVLGILLDGNRWNQRATVIDRDELPITVLTKKMGWPAIDRIWLPSWLRDREGEIARIQQAYEAACEIAKHPRVRPKRESKILSPASDSAETHTPTQAATEEVPQSPTDGGSHPGTNGGGWQTTSATSHTGGVDPVRALITSKQPFFELQSQVFGSQDTLNYLFDQSVQSAIRSIADQLTQHEGPVSAERFAKFVGQCFGYSRMTSQRSASINEVSLPGHERDDETFIFPKGVAPAQFTDWRVCFVIQDQQIRRDPRAVSLTELSNIAVDVTRVAHGFELKRLIAEVSSVLGVKSVSELTHERVHDAIQFAITQGRLRFDGDYVQAN